MNVVKAYRAPERHAAGRRGFSVVEMALALGIIALVLGMSASAGSLQLEIAHIKGTKANLEVVRKALNLYQEKYGKYPCPARLDSGGAPGAALDCSATIMTYASGTLTNGTYRRTRALVGAVPYVTLGISKKVAYDAWGRKITYALDRSHALTSLDTARGWIPVLDRAGTSLTGSGQLGRAVFVLVSHGKNGAGAYTEGGAVGTACPANTVTEYINCNTAATADSFRDAPINESDTIPNSYTDDLVLWQQQEHALKREDAYPDPEVKSYAFSKTISAGDSHACLTQDIGGQPWCWGLGTNGRLGDATTTTRNAPVLNAPSAGNPPNLTSAIDISAGTAHTCMVDGSYNAYCWGSDADGQLGNAASGSSTSPSAVSTLTNLTNVKQISAGGQHTCAVTWGGVAYCWGDDTSKQLGNDAAPTADQHSPLAVDTTAFGDATVSMISAGWLHTCAITTDKVAYCWGEDGSEQLGNGTGTADQGTPVAVTASSLTNVVYISAGTSHTCAVDEDGAAYCWGSDASEQLGNGATAGTQTSPIAVSSLTTGVVQISAGAAHSCAVKANGIAYCWGAGASGQIGDGNNLPRTTPVQVSNITDFVQVSAGNSFSCGARSNGQFWCWGSEANGRLGNGATAGTQTSPVQATGVP